RLCRPSLSSFRRAELCAKSPHRRHRRAWRGFLCDRRIGGLGLHPAQCGGRRGTMRAALGWLLRGGVLGVIAFVIFGPLANLVLWAVAIQWYFPHKLPLTYGSRYWGEVFKPTSDALASLGTSILIASITVLLCLLLAIPAGYALGRRSLPGRGLILLLILLPQAFPSVAVYLNIARLFYFVGVPDVTTLPLMMFTASLGGNYQIAAITALILLIPSIAFMLLIERFLNTEMLAKVG